MSVINTNITALIGQQNLGRSQSALQTAMERLSSGLRINSAKDDAAGQAIANRMSAQITGLMQAQRNASDGISVAQTTEGALNQINDNLQRIRELTVQAQNGTNTDEDLTSIQNEIDQRLDEINRISEETSFNGVRVLAEDTSLRIQVGANDGQAIRIDLKQINSQTLGLNGFNVDGHAEIANRQATLSDLEVAEGFTTTATANQYEVRTVFDEASLDRLIEEVTDGDIVTVGAGTAAVTYTYNAAEDAFTFEDTVANNTDVAAAHLPSSGTISGVYEMTDGDLAHFEVDAVGNVTLNGQVAYLSDTGELTTNKDDPSNTQATLKDLFDAAEAAASSTLTVDGVTYNNDGAGALTFTNTLSTNEVLAAADGKVAQITLTNGVTSATVEFTAAGAQTTGAALDNLYVDYNGELTTLEEFTTTFAQNEDTGEVTVVGNVDANGNEYTGEYALEKGGLAYISSDGRLTTDTTSKGDRTDSPLNVLDEALRAVDALRSDLGAIQNRFESAIINLDTTTTNLSAARSRIEDADYAVEVSNLTRAQILQQAGTAVLAQANQVPQTVLSLLG